MNIPNDHLQLYSNNCIFPIPYEFKAFVRVSNNIKKSFFFNGGKYCVRSKVRNEILQSFLDYWVQEKEFKVNVDNIWEYSLLSNEFDLFKDIVSKSEYKNILHLSCLIYITKEKSFDHTIDMLTAELYIAQHLDYYLENYQNEMRNIPLNSLYNIFFHKERKMTNHANAYSFITGYSNSERTNEPNNHSNIGFFILLQSIDCMKLSQEAALDAHTKVSDHCGFLPQNSELFLKDQAEMCKKKELENKIIKEKLLKLISSIEGRPIEEMENEEFNDDKIASLCIEATKCRTIKNIINKHIPNTHEDIKEIESALNLLNEQLIKMKELNQNLNDELLHKKEEIEKIKFCLEKMKLSNDFCCKELDDTKKINKKLSKELGDENETNENLKNELKKVKEIVSNMRQKQNEINKINEDLTKKLDDARENNENLYRKLNESKKADINLSNELVETKEASVNLYQELSEINENLYIELNKTKESNEYFLRELNDARELNDHLTKELNKSKEDDEKFYKEFSETNENIYKELNKTKEFNENLSKQLNETKEANKNLTKLLKETKEANEKSYNELSDINEKLYNELEETKQKIEILTKELNETKEVNKCINKELNEAKEENKSFIKEDNDKNNDFYQELSQINDNLNDELSTARKSNENLTKDFNNAKEANETLIKELDETKESYEKLYKELSETNENIYKELNETKEFNENLSKKLNETKEINETLAKLLKETKETNEKSYNELSEINEKLYNELEETKLKNENLNKEMNEIKQENYDITKELSETNEANQQLYNELSETNENLYQELDESKHINEKLTKNLIEIKEANYNITKELYEIKDINDNQKLEIEAFKDKIEKLQQNLLKIASCIEGHSVEEFKDDEFNIIYNYVSNLKNIKDLIDKHIPVMKNDEKSIDCGILELISESEQLKELLQVLTGEENATLQILKERFNEIKEKAKSDKLLLEEFHKIIGGSVNSESLTKLQLPSVNIFFEEFSKQKEQNKMLNSELYQLIGSIEGRPYEEIINEELDKERISVLCDKANKSRCIKDLIVNLLQVHDHGSNDILSSLSKLIDVFHKVNEVFNVISNENIYLHEIKNE